MAASQGSVVLKLDALGRVERVAGPEGPRVRRVACGGALPGSAWLARWLLARERRALRELDGLPGVARVIAEPGPGVLEREWLPGRPLCQADRLPRDFFERLEDLVRAVHARGVCHNDLHKEGNVLVGEDGRPALVDFQLASVHARRGRRFEARAREDLRHVWKHRSVYLRATGREDPLEGAPPRRSWVAQVWRRHGKRLYRVLKRSALGQRHLAGGEPRRPKNGPWPVWTAPVGPAGAAAGRTGPVRTD
jgi:RIO-like serine/threonine protein kinase